MILGNVNRGNIGSGLPSRPAPAWQMSWVMTKTRAFVCIRIIPQFEISRIQSGEECAITCGKSLYCKEPPAPTREGATFIALPPGRGHNGAMAYPANHDSCF